MAGEVLPLRDVPSAAPECATLPVATELLHSFTAIFSNAEPGPDYEPLVEELTRQSTALAAARGRHAIAEIAEPIVSTSRKAVAAVRRRQEARRHDIASLLSVVRSTVDSLNVDHDASTTALGASTERLDLLQNVTSFFELKQLLAQEVATLRTIAAEREREHARVVGSLCHKLAEAEEQLCVARTEALTDALTEIANRRGFDAALAQHVREIDPTSTLVLAVFDVDSFKAINDRFGHPAGDGILRQLASTIRDCVRQDDVVARIGGDEFALIAAGLTLGQAKSRLQGIVQTIVRKVEVPEGAVVSVSCGAAEWSAGDTPQAFLHRADTALREAKALGKNRVVTRSAPYIRTLLAAGR